MTEETKVVAEAPEKKKPVRRRRKTKEVDVVTETVNTEAEDVELPAHGTVKHEAEAIEPVEAPLESDHAQHLAFMEERVTIHLHDPQDNNPEPIVPVGVNGKVLYLRRGETHTLPRKYIEVLARARRVNYRSQEAVAADGSRTMVLKSSTTLQYPFTVVSDPSGAKGAEWLKRIMNERV